MLHFSPPVISGFLRIQPQGSQIADRIIIHKTTIFELFYFFFFCSPSAPESLFPFILLTFLSFLWPRNLYFTGCFSIICTRLKRCQASLPPTSKKLREKVYNMIRFICVVVFLILFLILTIPVFFIEWLIGKFNRNARDYSCLRIVQWGFKAILKVTGVHTTVIGFENIPDEPVLFIGNHRSFFDILLTYSRCPRLTGYVAKKGDGKKFRFYLPGCALYTVCFWTVRIQKRDWKPSFRRSIMWSREFPSVFSLRERETKAKSSVCFLLKRALLRSPPKTGCAIVPISMNNTAAIFENQFPRIKKVNVVVEYGTPIYPKDLAPEDKKHIGAYVQNIIQETINKNAELIWFKKGDFLWEQII